MYIKMLYKIIYMSTVFIIFDEITDNEIESAGIHLYLHLSLSI